MKAVMLAAHGKKDDNLGDAAQNICDALSGVPDVKVYCGYNANRSPSIKESLESIVADGFDEVSVVPIFFAPGMIAHGMVPEAIGLGSGNLDGYVEVNGKKIHVKVTDVFGNHPKMAAVIKAVLKKNGSTPEDTTIIMIGHGSKDPANSTVVGFNVDLAKGMGYEAYCAYNEFLHPTVEEALDAALNSGKKKVLAIPLFVSPGGHTLKDIPPKLGLESYGKRICNVSGTEVELTYTTEIGMEPSVSEIVLSRINEN